MGDPRSLVLDEDELSLRDTLDRFIRDVAPLRSTRLPLDDGGAFDAWPSWQRAVSEIGLPGISLPSARGGSDLGPRMQSVAFQATGTQLAYPYLLPSVGMAGALLASLPCSPFTDHLLEELASGVSFTVAYGEFSHMDPYSVESGIAVHPDDRASGAILEGSLEGLIGLREAGRLIVVARAPDGDDALYGVDLGPLRRSVTPLESLDLTREYGAIELDGWPARRLDSGNPGEWLVRGLALANLYLASEQLGGAEACLEMTVRYAQQRVQFGRTIGSFQAVKHRCADMLVAVERARSAVALARAAAQDARGELKVLAVVARKVAAEAFRWVASSAVHVHGGLGFTWEHDAHLYLRRAKASQYMLGSPHAVDRFLAQHLELG